ncbi:MAG: hypothetical protein ACXV8J_00010 [Methylobacter sp.]
MPSTAMDRRLQKRTGRYLAQQERVASDCIERLDINGWFDFWHTHSDMKCKANCAKSMVALLTYKLLEKAEALFENRQAPIQIWATFCEETGNNAVYIHSPSPNNSSFPYDFDGVVWGTTEPPEVIGLLHSTHEIGKYQYDDEIVYVVRKKA